MEKEQWVEVLKTKDRRGVTEEAMPIPTFNPEIAEDCRKLWCDEKRQFKVQIGRLSQLGFWVTVGIGPQFCIMVRPSGHLFKHVFCIMKG